MIVHKIFHLVNIFKNNFKNKKYENNIVISIKTLTFFYIVFLRKTFIIKICLNFM